MTATPGVERTSVGRLGPSLLVLLCTVPVALWLLTVPLDQRFAGSFAALTSLAVVSAYAGTAAFALNLVVGARLRIVERLFGGLGRMYGVHRRTGEAAFALLLGHVVLVLAGRSTISAEAALDLLGPAAGFTVFAGVLGFAGLTVAIALTLFARLGHEVFVYVQRAFGLVFLLAAYHALTTDGTTHDSRALDAYLTFLATVGIGAFAYRSVLGSVLVRRRRHRVCEVNRLDELVTEIVMEPVGKPLEHAPGQFVFVSFPSLDLRALELSLESQVLAIRAGEVRGQFHPFSITSAPGAEMLRITVKALGDYTHALRRLETGAEALVEGPFGSFSHRNVEGRRQVWVAGGIGVTPFLSMARSLGDGEPLSVDFYYCVEHEVEAHFLEELRARAAQAGDFRVNVVSRQRAGFLTATRLAAEVRDLASAEVLVCGPPAMIESLRTQLAVAGVAPRRFHAEEFSFANVGHASASEVGRPRPPLEPRHGLSDGQLIAVLAALAFTAVVFAIGVAVGGSL